MGCDIHAVIEYIDNSRDWDGYIYWFAEIDLNRDYLLFALMADVRNNGSIEPVAKPRGLPSHTSYKVTDMTILYVDDKIAAEKFYDSCNYVSRAQAVKWNAEWRVQDKSIIDVDTHSHSWLAATELEEVAKRMRDATGKCPRPTDEIEAVVQMMRVLERGGNKVRLTFWFDN